MDWSYFWLSIGGNALATTGIAFLAKILVEKKLKEEQLRFEHKLATRLAAFSNRHGILASKHAAIIAKLYRQLTSIRKALEILAGSQGDIELAEAQAAIRHAFASFRETFDNNCVFLDQELEDKVTALHDAYWTLTGTLQTRNRLSPEHPRFEAFASRIPCLIEKADIARGALKSAFRGLLNGKTEDI